LTENRLIYEKTRSKQGKANAKRLHNGF